ncbi:DUF4132 domain-containing protein [Spirillospora sp. NPDC029432]|uniref:DUF4132 domain-containing protein n=1 Tax=Spirillospora sp. NPDC029432 TaxID=3154599 RepID=UPI00345396A8
MDEPPAEDALVIPDAWRRILHPRRGGAPGPPIEIDASAAAALRELVARKRPELDRVRAGTGGDPEIVEAIRDQLAGRPVPLGAAAVARLVYPAVDDRSPRPLVDAWVTELGVPFAAAACAELCALETAETWQADKRMNPASGIGRATAFPSTDDGFLAAAARMRAILAAADEHDYRDAVTRLADHRRTEPQRVIVSFMVPTRQDWVDECRVLTEPRSPYTRMLWCAFGDARQAARMRGLPRDENGEPSLDVLATVADGIGAGLVPALLRALSKHPYPGPDRRVFLEVLGAMPSDEALTALIEWRAETHALEALTAAMDRYPGRALRLLAEAAAGAGKDTLPAELLTWLVRARPDLAAAERHRPAVARVLAAETRAEPAAPGDLPRLLAEPPWTRKRKKPGEPPAIELAPPGDRAEVWAPGERDAWRAASSASGRWFAGTARDWPSEVKSCRENPDGLAIGHLIAEGPEELVRPLLSEWRWHARGWEAADGVWMRAVVARHGLDALPVALHAARANPGGCGKLLLPYLDDEVAALMAGWLSRLKSARPAAIAWFTRHGAAAARALVPSALASKDAPRAAPRAGRQDAERALRLIASDIGKEAVIDAARSYGAEPADAIAALLSTDPLEVLPPRIPKLPAWADPAVLPPVLLNGRTRALPTTEPLLVMLAISKPGEAYAGLDVVRETCDPESLAEFGWSLFMRWRAYGEPSRHAWALHQLGWTGNDRTVRRLTPFIRSWPGEGGHRKAVTGLDVLAEIGTDVALTHLHGCTRRLRFKGLKARAAEKIDDIAAARGLTPLQLADRMVPDFGLNAEGGMTLDYGPRRFIVGFGEQLDPYITDENGARRKLLPRASATDDQQLATAARQRFTALKKEVKTVAETQIRRLEAAMVDRRRWTAAEFRDLFAAHPLLWHIVRRLVWLSEDGGKTTAFRLAEDRTLADADDAVLTLAESAEIGLAHPADLGDRLRDWRQTFDDYELLQPFPQLDRPVQTLTPAERRATRLTRPTPLLIDPAGATALRARGWTRRTADGAYVEDCLFRPAPPSGFLVLNTTHHAERTERVTHIWCADHPGPYSPARARPLCTLHPATASELLTTLTTLEP